MSHRSLSGRLPATPEQLDDAPAGLYRVRTRSTTSGLHWPVATGTSLDNCPSQRSVCAEDGTPTRAKRLSKTMKVSERETGACGCADPGSSAGTHCCCGAESLLYAIARKHTMSILNRIGHGPGTRFRDLEQSLHISSSTLAETLEDLVLAGLVSRAVLPDRPPRTEYQLTAAGRALVDRFRPLLEVVRASVT